VRRRAAAPDIAGRVLLTGALPRTASLSHLRGSDLFVFASRTETQGLVLAEALAAGVPAIAVDGPGVRDSVRDGIDGMIVEAMPERDRAARLADVIVALASDPVRRGALAEAASGDADRFDLSVRVAEIERLYASLTAGA
jgi:glycosyltransferase involved in cell wall biosynthesis